MRSTRFAVFLLTLVLSGPVLSSPRQARSDDVTRARALVVESDAVRAKSDYPMARSKASEAAVLLLAAPSEAHDAEWLAVLELAGAAALDAQDESTARDVWLRVVEVRTRAFPEAAAGLLKAHNNLANALYTLGDLAGARVQFTHALEFAERALPADHPNLLSIRTNLGATLSALGDLAGAKALHEQVLVASERTLDDADLVLQNARTNLGTALYGLGDTAGAHALYEKVYAVRSRTLPEDHPDLQIARCNLALTFHTLGDNASAKRLIAKALEIDERTLPDDHPNLQSTRLTYASVLKAYGDFEAVRALEERVLEIQSRTLPEDHPDLLLARSSYAVTLHELGELEKARELQEQVLAIRSRTLPEDHLDLQYLRNNLATTLSALGDGARARALHEQVLDICSRTLPDDHPLLQVARENLAISFFDSGDRAAARMLHELVLEARSRALADGDILLEKARTNLACSLLGTGEPEAALRLFEKVLENYSRSLPLGHPRIELARMNVGAAELVIGDFEAAREHLQQATDALARAFPEGHRFLRIARRDLVKAMAAQEARTGPVVRNAGNGIERFEGVVIALCRATVRDARAAIVGSSGREAEERCVALDPDLDFVLSSARGLGVVRSSRAIENEAFVLSETTRGAALAATELVRRSSGAAAQADMRAELRNASGELARLAQQGTTLEALDRARARRDAAEQGLVAAARAQLGGARSPFELDADSIASRLAADQAAVSYRRYESTQLHVTEELDAAGRPSVRDLAEPRLCAFVVRSSTEPDAPRLQLVDLGPAPPIESAVRAWRDAIGIVQERGLSVSTQTDAVRDSGEALRELVFDPLVAALEDVRRVVVVPDDALHLVSLEALPLADSTDVLGDRWRFDSRLTLTELLDAPSPSPDGGVLLSVGGASFNSNPLEASAEELAEVGAEAPTQVAGLLRGSAWERGFEPLTHTADEARGVGSLYGEVFADGAALVLEKRKASRAVLTQLAPRARYLHVATHGWYAPQSIRSWDDPEPLDKHTGLGARTSGEERVRGMSPMLLCGLALAGANLPEDATGRALGLITAEEISALGLSNCELAVLSACDTSVGARRAGQGVASLQKALQMAGARSVITSLWKVPDEATKELMLDFYRRMWVEKKPKWQALWEAKQKLRNAKDERGMPKHTTRDWAAWVLTGNPD